MKTITAAQLASTNRGIIEYTTRNLRQEGKQQTVLSLHGAMGGYDQSDILGRTIGPARYNYLSVSRPGYLGTPLNDNAAPEAQADLLAALLDVLEIGSVIVFAISGGGYSALHFAERHPDRCRGLVLCSTTGGPNTDPIPFAFTVMKAAARVPFLLAVLRKRAAARPIASLRRSISHEDILEETLQNQKSMALYQELTCSTMTRMAERLPGTINDIKVTQRASYVLNTIQVPTLVVHGTDDKVVPFAEHGARLAREIPNARLCTAERGEHVAIFSHNTQIVDAVDDFLAQL